MTSILHLATPSARRRRRRTWDLSSFSGATRQRMTHWNGASVHRTCQTPTCPRRGIDTWDSLAACPRCGQELGQVPQRRAR